MPDARLPAGAFRPAELSRARPTAFALAPDAAARAALAEAFGLLALPLLRFEGELRPRGRTDWELVGRLEAEVEQACVVTLAPVRSRIAEEVLRRYVADLPPPPPGESEMPADDSLEPLGAVIDPAEVMAEALSLALPDYPRAEGAALPPGLAAAPEREHPFAALARLRERPPEG